MPKRTHKDISQLTQTVETQSPDLVAAPTEQVAPQRASRVVSIPLSEILPDRFQSRVILPPDIRGAFFAGEIDCYQAAQSLMMAADSDNGLRWQVDDLLRLGQSILNENQIEPVTGSWVQAGSFGRRFLLEAGERRFWSLVLKSIELGLQQELRLQAVEQKETSRLRQVVENLQREDISAVDLAKAVAAVILALEGKHPNPDLTNEMDYFREALDGRLPNGMWPELERIFGFARPHLVRHLQLLNLNDELLYLASLYRVEERRLRVIVAAPKHQQRELLLSAIEEKLSSDEIERAAEQKNKSDNNTRHRAVPVVYRQMASRVKSLLKFTQQSDFDRNYDRVATELSTLMKDPNELEQAARHLESLATSLRKIRGRRR
jgi:ParB-like chromosome segregation protein Spo0J